LKEDFFMFNKKFYLVGLAVLLSVSLIFLGCPTDASDGAAGPAGTEGGQGNQGEQGEPGTPEPVQFLQSAYNVTDINGVLAVADARAVVVVGATTITGPGVVDFGTRTVHIIGNVATAGSNTSLETLNLVDATVTFKNNAKILLGDATDVALLAEDQIEGHVGSTGLYGSGVADADAVKALTAADLPVGGVVAVKDYQLGSETLVDGLKLYVYGTLTVDADSAAPLVPSGTTITAIGTVAVAGDVPASVLATSGSASTVDVSAAVIAPTGDYEVTLPWSVDGYQFDLSGGGLTVKDTSSFGTTAGVDVQGDGTLVLDAVITQANITGTGRIVFDKAPVFATANSSIVTVGGYVSFKNGVKSPTSTLTLTLDGNVVVADTKTIGFGAVSTSAINLAAGTKLYAGDDPATGTEVLSVTGGNGVSLSTSAVTAILTVGTTGITQSDPSATTIVTIAPVTASVASTVNIPLAYTISTTGSATTLVVEDDVNLKVAGTLDVGGSITVKGTAEAVGSGNIELGGTTNGLTFQKALITGDGTTGVVFASGTATFAATDTLFLADGGSVATRGTGKAVFGSTDFSGVGAWTASGSRAAGTTGGYTANAAGVTITSATTGATIAVQAGTDGWTDGVLTASGTPTINQAADGSNDFVIGAGIEVALGGTSTTVGGTISLKNSAATTENDNGKLTLRGTITTGNEPGTYQKNGAPLSDDNTTVVANAQTYTKIGVANLKGDGTNVKVSVTNNPTDATTSIAGNIAKLTGAASSATIVGGDNTATTANVGTISSTTATAADSTSA
jgi:hypothetical protein